MPASHRRFRLTARRAQRSKVGPKSAFTIISPLRRTPLLGKTAAVVTNDGPAWFQRDADGNVLEAVPRPGKSDPSQTEYGKLDTDRMLSWLTPMAVFVGKSMTTPFLLGRCCPRNVSGWRRLSGGNIAIGEPEQSELPRIAAPDAKSREHRRRNIAGRLGITPQAGHRMSPVGLVA